jgi:hypothetical protein
MTQAFNLSQLANRVNTSGQLNAATGLFNQTPVANGGTGKSTVTTGALLLGAGTSAMTELTGTTAGTTVVASPTGWISAPVASVAGGNYQMETYTSPAVWTKPSTLKAIKVTVVGGGGNGGNSPSVPPPNTNTGGGGGGGGGGAVIVYFDAPAIPGSPITVTAGPGTNSFGGLASATVGSNGVAGARPSVDGAGGAGGIGTVPSPAPSGAITFTGVAGITANSPTFRGLGGSSQLFYTQMLLVPTGLANGIPNPYYGGGGSGASPRAPGSVQGIGGTGGPGIVIIEEFY